MIIPDEKQITTTYITVKTDRYDNDNAPANTAESDFFDGLSRQLQTSVSELNPIIRLYRNGKGSHSPEKHKF